MKFLQKIYEFIWSLCAVNYWLQQKEYNKVYDDWCKDQLKLGCNFTDITEYTAKLSGVGIWIKNHPYASFSVHERKTPEYRPSRYTMFLLHRKLKKQLEVVEKEKRDQHYAKLKSILDKGGKDA